MKGLILIVLLALVVVAYLVMVEEPKPVTVPTEQPESVSTAVKVETPPQPPVEQPKDRTPEEIRADVARKTAETVIRPVPEAPKPDPMAARNAKRAEYQAKINSKRSELSSLSALLDSKQAEYNRLKTMADGSRASSARTIKQWRWVVGGKVDESSQTWYGMETLPPVNARNGKLVKYREIPANSGASSQLANYQSAMSSMRSELDSLRNKKMVLESDIANLGMQMNMAQ